LIEIPAAGIVYLLNVGLFNVCWGATAWGVVNGMPWVGPVTICISLVIHVLLVDRPDREVCFLLLAGLTGYGIDSLLNNLRILEFSSQRGGYLAPLWLLFQWFAFCSLLHVSLRWLRGRYVLSAFLGLTGGASAYWSANLLGVLKLGTPRILSVTVVMLAWSMILPLLLWMSQLSFLDVDTVGPA